MEAQINYSIPVDDQFPWYAIRLFSIRQKGVEPYFQEAGLETFVPRQYVDFVDHEGRHHRELRPVVSNLLFIKKDREESLYRELFMNAPFRMSVVRRTRGSRFFYEIPSHEMFEFRVMCNPELMMRKYISESEARLKVGTPVRVTHGPLAGLTGKLVRQSKKYFLLKEVPGMGVMLKVTRWCCQPLTD